nr:stefin 2_4 [Myxidium lieberkuehni]
MSPMCGGFCDLKEADEYAKKVFEKTHSSICKNVKEKYGDFKSCELKGCKKQLVCGTNYLLKVDVITEKSTKTVWCKVFEGLPCHGGNIEYKGLHEDEHQATRIQ